MPADADASQSAGDQCDDTSPAKRFMLIRILGTARARLRRLRGASVLRALRRGLACGLGRLADGPL